MKGGSEGVVVKTLAQPAYSSKQGRPDLDDPGWYGSAEVRRPAETAKGAKRQSVSTPTDVSGGS